MICLTFYSLMMDKLHTNVKKLNQFLLKRFFSGEGKSKIIEKCRHTLDGNVSKTVLQGLEAPNCSANSMESSLSQRNF